MGLSMSSARMLRRFTISSRSPVRREKTGPNAMPPDGAGGSSGEDTGDGAVACCFACSVLAVGSAFLPQAIAKRRATKGNTNTRARNGAEVVDMSLLLYLDE